MLESKFKIVFLFVVLACAALPIAGIMKGTTLTPFEEPSGESTTVVEFRRTW
jgi:sulfatase modifying factor 1